MVKPLSYHLSLGRLARPPVDVLGGLRTLFFLICPAFNTISHAVDPTHLLTKWEILKCILRGLFFHYGVRLKRARSAEISRLLSLISSLESSHNRTLDPNTILYLFNNQRDLLRILVDQSLIARDRIRHVHYARANKCDQHLGCPIILVLLNKQFHI